MEFKQIIKDWIENKEALLLAEEKELKTINERYKGNYLIQESGRVKKEYKAKSWELEISTRRLIVEVGEELKKEAKKSMLDDTPMDVSNILWDNLTELELQGLIEAYQGNYYTMKQIMNAAKDNEHLGGYQFIGIDEVVNIIDELVNKAINIVITGVTDGYNARLYVIDGGTADEASIILNRFMDKIYWYKEQ